MKPFYKKPYVYIIAIIAIIILFAVFRQPAKLKYEFATVAKADISRSVSVTGSVKPAENVDLAFEAGGKISRTLVSVGDQVKAGQMLAALDNADLIAALNQAEASLASEQAKLADYKSGTRPEEIQVAETTVDNAITNLASVKNKATVDLNNVYDGTIDVLQDAYAKADDGINKQIDDLFDTTDPLDPKISFFTSDSALQGLTENQRLEADRALKYFKIKINSLGADQAELDKALIDGETHLSAIRKFLTTLTSLMNSTVSLSAATIATYKEDVNTGRTNVNTAITNINAKMQAIAAQKALNQSSVNTAENTLSSAKDNLKLKQAGYTLNQIASAQALAKYAEANVQSAQAKIAKTLIYSPISGIVTRQDAKAGEIIAAGKTTISVMSDANFEIETQVPETDIADVKTGDRALVTLDAYGSGQTFSAVVSFIDPAETKIDNVATYKVTLQFENKDGRLKSGMTANIDIRTASKTNVLVIPQRAVLRRNSDQFVSVDEGGDAPVEKKIETGLRGSDGNIEVISGLNEGDKVITSTL
ncbi:MAG: efflux RND transporter periplasmic adaptor subunit [Parcubacteria group bacterium]